MLVLFRVFRHACMKAALCTKIKLKMINVISILQLTKISQFRAYILLIYLSKGALYQYIIYSTNANALMTSKHVRENHQNSPSNSHSTFKDVKLLLPIETLNCLQDFRAKHSENCQVNLQRENSNPFLTRTSKTSMHV